MTLGRGLFMNFELRGLCSGRWMRPRSCWREMLLLDEPYASSNRNSTAVLIRKIRSDCGPCGERKRCWGPWGSELRYK